MCQASRSPHTDNQTQQQDAAEQVAGAQCSGDGGDRDEAQAPRDVDDVVPADAGGRSGK